METGVMLIKRSLCALIDSIIAINGLKSGKMAYGGN
jgi:hypothetical protein